MKVDSLFVKGGTLQKSGILWINIQIKELNKIQMYILNPERRGKKSSPSQSYKETILQGYKDFGWKKRGTNKFV